MDGDAGFKNKANVQVQKNLHYIAGPAGAAKVGCKKTIKKIKKFLQTDLKKIKIKNPKRNENKTAIQPWCSQFPFSLIEV